MGGDDRDLPISVGGLNDLGQGAHDVLIRQCRHEGVFEFVRDEVSDLSINTLGQGVAYFHRRSVEPHRIPKRSLLRGGCAWGRGLSFIVKVDAWH